MHFLDTNQTPPQIVGKNAIKRAHPNTSFRADFPATQIEPLGFYRFTVADRPEINAGQRATLGGFEKSKTGWQRVWDVEDLPPETLVQMIKDEAGRRIEAILPPHAQSNFLAWHAETSMTHGPDPANWPAEEQAAAQDGLAKWAKIKAIRAASNTLEAMTPIPADFDADKWWT